MAHCLTIKELNKLRPCAVAGRRVRAALCKLDASPDRCFDASAARQAGCTFDDIIWAPSSVAEADQ